MSDTKLIVIISSIIALLIVSSCGIQLFTVDNVESQVIDKERVVKSDLSYYLIHTEQEVFKNKDVLVHRKFNSSDLQGKLEVGKTYDFMVYGFRIPFFSAYRNIISYDIVIPEVEKTTK